MRQQIFDYVRAAGLVSRADVAKALGVSPGTVSTITAELIEAGLLREDIAAREPGEVARGRPPVALSVRADAFAVAGVKLSDRERTAILVDFAGEQLASLSVPPDPCPASPEAQIGAVEAMLTRLLADAGVPRARLGAVGVGLPGFVDHASGHVFWSPVLSRRNVDFRRLAEDALGLHVAVDNDANLVALAELWFGIGREKSDFAVVTVENGVGIGVVLGHRLFRGANGLGLELGHTKVQLDGALCRCGQRGCLEAYVADYALAREATAALGLDGGALPSTPEVLSKLAAEAQRGNEAARSIFARAGRFLAAGLSNVVNLFDPSLLILSGDRMRYDHARAEEAAAAMADFVLNTGHGLPPLQVHEWGDLLWAHGAAALGLARLTEDVLAREEA